MVRHTLVSIICFITEERYLFRQVLGPVLPYDASSPPVHGEIRPPRANVRLSRPVERRFHVCAALPISCRNRLNHRNSMLEAA